MGVTTASMSRMSVRSNLKPTTDECLLRSFWETVSLNLPRGEMERRPNIKTKDEEKKKKHSGGSHNEQNQLHEHYRAYGLGKPNLFLILRVYAARVNSPK